MSTQVHMHLCVPCTQSQVCLNSVGKPYYIISLFTADLHVYATERAQHYNRK